MPTTLKDVLDRLPAERRQRVETRAEELIAEEMSLRELRKAMDKTQAQLALKTGKSQVTLSRLERQSDMLISTLDKVVRGLGGRVRILAELPNRPPRQAGNGAQGADCSSVGPCHQDDAHAASLEAQRRLIRSNLRLPSEGTRLQIAIFSLVERNLV